MQPGLARSVQDGNVKQQGGCEKSHRLLHLDSYKWNPKNYWIPYDTTWTLDKAHAGAKETSRSMPSPSLFTSSVQQVIFEEFDGTSGRMVALSNLAHPDLLGAAKGHKTNGRSVVTGVWFTSLCALSLCSSQGNCCDVVC